MHNCHKRAPAARRMKAATRLNAAPPETVSIERAEWENLLECKSSSPQVPNLSKYVTQVQSLKPRGNQYSIAATVECPLKARCFSGKRARERGGRDQVEARNSKGVKTFGQMLPVLASNIYKKHSKCIAEHGYNNCMRPQPAKAKRQRSLEDEVQRLRGAVAALEDSNKALKLKLSGAKQSATKWQKARDFSNRAKEFDGAIQTKWKDRTRKSKDVRDLTDHFKAICGGSVEKRAPLLSALARKVGVGGVVVCEKAE